MKKFDYLVVGSGLYGAIFAHEAKAHAKLYYYIQRLGSIMHDAYINK